MEYRNLRDKFYKFNGAEISTAINDINYIKEIEAKTMEQMSKAKVKVNTQKCRDQFNGRIN